MKSLNYKLIEDREIWDNLYYRSARQSFLQNWLWGEVARSLNRQVFRIGFFSNNNLIGGCQLIGYKAQRGRFLTLPHGPLDLKINEILEFLSRLKKIRIFKGYKFLRANFCYSREVFLKNRNLFKGFFKVNKPFVTENFIVIDLQAKNVEEILRKMSQHHQKLILEAENKPFLEVEFTKDIKKLDIFLDLYRSLAKEKKFIPYPSTLLKKEFEIFSGENRAFLALGKAAGKYYSGAMIILDQKTAYYHHAASIPIKEPLNYKLHWRIILELKKMDFKFYNLWGFTESKDPKHPWLGFTFFKEGFGGQKIYLLPTFDYPLSWQYYLIRIYELTFEKLRRSIFPKKFS